MKCEHPACICDVTTDTFGKYCSEHCRDAGDMNDLKCECGHDACIEDAAGHP